METAGLEAGVYFDHDGNRFAEKMGWVGSDDAILARDLNGNGQIDDGGEMFGNNAILANGQKAASGFEALAELDANGDGVVDQNDEGFSILKLWRDANGNGTVEEGELLTLTEAGAASLNVAYSRRNYTDENGNEHRQGGSFTREDGSTGQMADVWLKNELADSRYLDKIEVSEAIAALPKLRSYGQVADLWQVMARDEGGALQTLLEEFADSDPQTAKNLVWDIIFAWTGVTELDPGSRGPNIGDARKLYAMERLWGQDFLSLDGNGVYHREPHAIDSVELKKAFADWEQKILSYLLLNNQYADLYALVVRGSRARQAGASEAEALSPLLEAFGDLYASGLEADRSRISDFMATLKVYDSRGLACVEALKSYYIKTKPADEFSDFDTLIHGGGDDVPM
ncbi:MAG: hypothetical protein LBS31_06845 [Candidatus Adiutrix sp.]|nr:hypothetical protein [Candidatus Adiutrix sp.]